MRRVTVLTSMACALVALGAPSLVQAAPFEPNDSEPLATPVTGPVSAAIETSNDIDYYKFTTTQPAEQIHLTITPWGNYWHPISWKIVRPADEGDRLRTPGDLRLPGATDMGGTYPFRIVIPGTYYLVIENRQRTDDVPGADKPYSFVIDHTQGSGEPNDSYEQATPLTPGTPVNAGAEVDRDDDVYKFTAPNDNMVARLTLTSGALVLSDENLSFGATIMRGAAMYLKTPSGKEPVAYPNAGIVGANVSTDVQLAENGTYYPVVTTDKLVNSYTLSVTLSGGTPPVPTRESSPRAPGISGRCLSARRNVRAATRTVSRLRRKLLARPTKAHRRSYNRARARLNHFKRQRSAYC